MRIIIKQMSLLFMLFAVLLAFVGCGDTIADTTPADTTPADTPPDSIGQSKGFVVSGKKSVYKNKDVLLLNVENQTDKDYDVTAVVRYFDAEGNEIKTQKQTFVGWAAGYQNYFLFQPNIVFDTFTCALELEDFDGEECFSKYITVAFIGVDEAKQSVAELREKGDYTKWPTIVAEFRIKNECEKQLFVEGYRVTIDKNGNIYHINSFAQNSISPQAESFDLEKLYYDLTTDKLVWPEELTGDVTGVYIITRVWQ